MRPRVFYFTFFLSLMVLTLSHAGQVTLSTTYPSPTGNYTRLKGTGFILTPATRSNIEGMYGCNNIIGPWCPEGLMYFDSVTGVIYYSTGTASGWKPLNGTGTLTCTTRDNTSSFGVTWKHCNAGETVTGGGMIDYTNYIQYDYPIDASNNPADSSHPATGWKCIGAYATDTVRCFVICC